MEPTIDPNQILLIEPNQTRRHFYALNLKIWVNQEVMAFKSVEDSIEFLESEQGQNIKLLISKPKIKDKDIFPTLISKFNQRLADGTLKLVNIGPGEIQHDAIENLSNSYDAKKLVQICANSLKITAKMMASLSVSQYTSFQIDLVGLIHKTPVNIFKKLEDETYECVMELETQMHPDQIMELREIDGHSHLYCLSKDRLLLTQSISDEVVSQISVDEIDKDELTTVSDINQKVLRQKISDMGITDETIKLTEKSIKSMSKNVKAFPTLKALLHQMLKNNSSYLFKHSQLLMLVAGHVIDNIDWGNKEQKEKIYFIALMHDIVLTHDSLATIHSAKELKEANLKDELYELVNTHAQKSAELISKYPKAPMGADAIIRQHHGIAHGVGFSEHYSGNLSPMSIVFILCEHFVKKLLDQGANFNFKQTIKELRDTYSTQRFKKIIDLMETLQIN